MLLFHLLNCYFLFHRLRIENWDTVEFLCGQDLQWEQVSELTQWSSLLPLPHKVHCRNSKNSKYLGIFSSHRQQKSQSFYHFSDVKNHSPFMYFLTIERKLHDITVKEILHIFTDKTSVCLAFLLLSLNGAGKVTTTYYAWKKIILPSPSGKEVNAFVRTSRASQNFWKARFLLGSFALAQFFPSAAAPLPRSEEELQACPPRGRGTALSGFCKCSQPVTAACSLPPALAKRSKAGLQEEEPRYCSWMLSLDPVKLREPRKATLRNAPLRELRLRRDHLACAALAITVWVHSTVAVTASKTNWKWCWVWWGFFIPKKIPF